MLVCGVSITLYRELSPVNTANQSKVYFKHALEKNKGRNYAGAIQDYTKAIESDSKNVMAYLGRGIAKGELLDWKGAIQDYDKVILLNPTGNKIGVAYLARGVAKNKLDDKKGSLQDLKKAAQLGEKDAHQIIQQIEHSLGDGSPVPVKETLEFTPEQEKVIKSNMEYWNKSKEEVVEALKKRGLI